MTPTLLTALLLALTPGQRTTPPADTYRVPPPPSSYGVPMPPACIAPFELTADGGRVRLRRAGQELDARADRMALGADGRLVLEGHVEVKTKRAKVSADRVVIRLADGAVEVGAPESPAVVPAPLGESVPVSGGPIPAADPQRSCSTH